MRTYRGHGLWGRTSSLGLILICLLLFFLLAGGRHVASSAPAEDAAIAAAGATRLVSVDIHGAPSKSAAAIPAISFNGRFVAFESRATNLVPGDSNGRMDVFVYDLQLNKMELASVATNGELGNGDSYEASISGDGRYVVFTSKATNLTRRGNDSYRGPGINVFRHDRQTGETIAISVNNQGAPADRHAWLGDISSDGNFVTFSSHSNHLVEPDRNGIKRDTFIRDVPRGTTKYNDLLPNGENPWGGGSYGSVSEGGRVVAYRSIAGDIVPGDTNLTFDIFAIDRQTMVTKRVSVSSSGAQGNVMAHYPQISNDGRYVVFQTASSLAARDTNGQIDVYIHDLRTGETSLASVASNGNPANGASARPEVSGDGRYVVFSSQATNLAPSDHGSNHDIFVHDRQTGQTIHASVNNAGQGGNGASTMPVISGDGRVVAFMSTARLVSGVNTSASQIYVRQLSTEPTYTIAGRVTAEGGAALAGVRVAAGGLSTETDGDGRYTLTNVPAGNHTVTATKSGYSFTPASRNVSVPPDAAEVNFTGAPLPTYAVRGVVSTSGGPLAGVTVSDGAGHSAVTNGQGQYSLELPEGSHTLTPALAGYAFDPPSRAVSVPPEADGVDFTAVSQATYTIAGFVKLADGTPIRGAVVSDGAGHTATTTLSGRYELRGLPAGTHTITASKGAMTFRPASRVVTVPPNATGQGFTGSN